MGENSFAAPLLSNGSVGAAFESRRPVSSSSFESLLAQAGAGVANPVAGLFGPDSITWRVNRESALFLGAGRAALLQLAHPWVMAALSDHSTLLERPIARFHNTFRIVFTVVFGSLPQAMAAARHLYGVHTQIQGDLKEDTAGWKWDTHYQANETHALVWVFATLIESAVMVYECALRPLEAGEREQYYAEAKRMAALFGIASDALPESWDAFRAYIEQMYAGSELGVSAEARRYGSSLLKGSGSWIRPPHWYQALTVAWLPERLRREFFFDFGPSEQTAAARAARQLPGFYRTLPRTVRFVGPYQEARARLAGRGAGMLARLSNRFWIGEPHMPFAEGM